MTTRATWINRALILIAWMVITAGISFYVARNVATGEESVDVTAPLPPVELHQRATVSLEEKTIVPVVSANGTVMNYDGTWMLEAPATSDDVAYRLLDPPVGVRAQINGGPSGFACEWIGLGQTGVPGSTASESPDEREADAATPAASPEASTEGFTVRPMAFVPMGNEPGSPAQPDTPDSGVQPSTAGVTMRCEIPEDVRVAAGMTGLMVLQMGQPHDAQALPVTAVVGAVDQGQVVVVYDDGTTELRTVQLGVSDIYNIEITGGLEPGEAVLQTPTQADFAQAQEGS